MVDMNSQKMWDWQWQSFAKNLYLKINKGVIREILRLLNGKVKNKKILEVGAGSGSDCIALAKKGAKCFALDFSSKALEVCLQLAKQEKIELKTIQADCSKIPFKDSYFDLVFSVGLLEHFKEPLPVIQEQIRVLKRGGFLIIDVPQKYNLYTLVKHLKMWLGRYPLDWETQYSVNDFKKIAKILNLDIVRFYGRDTALGQKLSSRVRYLWLKFFSRIEKSLLAPWTCLNIGMICQK